MDENAQESIGEGPEVVLIEKGGQPMHEGVSQGPESEGTIEPKHLLRLSKATGLVDLSADYVFFTYGLIFTHGRWLSDPMIDYIKEQFSKGVDCEPFHVQLPKPAFKWFDAKGPDGQIIDDQWNHQLCGIPKEQWDAAFAFLSSLSGVHHDTKFFHTLIPQRIPVVDVLALEKCAVLPDPVPQVDVICFALTSNRSTVYFAPEHRRGPWEPVPVMTRNPEAAVKELAKAFFDQRTSPMAGTIEPTRVEAEQALKAAVFALPVPEKMTEAELKARCAR